MKLKKGFTLVEMLIVVTILGIIASALLPRLKAFQDEERAKQEIQKEMPKTYEYVVSNGIFLSLESFKWICQKENKTEIVSDEVCYNRIRVLENCQNLKNNQPTYINLEKLVSLVENEQQADTIINKCITKKQETLKEEINKLEIKEESHENDEKINMMVESLF